MISTINVAWGTSPLTTMKKIGQRLSNTWLFMDKNCFIDLCDRANVHTVNGEFHHFNLATEEGTDLAYICLRARKMYTLSRPQVVPEMSEVVDCYVNGIPFTIPPVVPEDVIIFKMD